MFCLQSQSPSFLNAWQAVSTLNEELNVNIRGKFSFRSSTIRTVSSTSGKFASVDEHPSRGLDDIALPTERDAFAAGQIEDASVRREVDGLNEKFGKNNVRFGSAAGMRVVQLSTANGCSARIVIDEARVTSYKAMMWHNGEEEMLYTRVNKSSQEGPMVLRGGIVMSFPAYGGMIAGGRRVSLAELAARGHWEVAASSEHNEGSWSQVVLSLTNDKAPEYPSPNPAPAQNTEWSPPFCLRYCITLSSKGLAVSMKVINSGNSPLVVAPSVAAHILVATTRGTILMGTKGYSFLDARGKVEEKAPDQRKKGLWGLGRFFGQREETNVMKNDKAELSPRFRFAAEGELSGDKVAGRGGGFGEGLDVHGWMGEESPSALREETEEEAKVKGFVRRIFPGGPTSVTLLDRGLRRSVQINCVEFEDLMVENPGEEAGLQDWDEFISLGFARANKAARISPGEYWEGAYIINNLGAP